MTSSLNDKAAAGGLTYRLGLLTKGQRGDRLYPASRPHHEDEIATGRFLCLDDIRRQVVPVP